MNIDIIYRCCEKDTKTSFRPKRFSKINCLNNFLDVFLFNNKPKGINIRIHVVHDGEKGCLYKFLEDYDLSIHKINYENNAKSLDFCLDFAANIDESSDIIYFLEDDYLHIDQALEVLIEGFNVANTFNKSNVISLYDHMDRLTRNDDIDYGKTNILLGDLRYWRTAESTTCTWAVKRDIYLNSIYNVAKSFGLNDRELFRELRKQGVILFTPMIGASTHCHEPFMSPFIDWDNV